MGCTDNDGDGICAEDDCNDSDKTIGKVGSSCDDKNPNTENDRLQGDCTCKGTPIGCTDYDGDGVCAEDDCDDNNAQIRGVGSSCDDGNPNTDNDRRQSDCSCEGTPNGGGTSGDCDAITVQEGSGTITIGNFGGAIPLIKTWAKDQGWIVKTYCDDETCGDPYTINTGSGRFKVEIKLFSDRLWGNEICTVVKENVVVAGSRSAGRLAFSAYSSQEEISIQWVTNTGWRNSHYEVQRSGDGKEFETITMADNQNSTDENTYYQHKDLQPSEGINYYRLKQVYTDQTYDFSEIHQVNFIPITTFAVFPNPAKDEVFINLKEYAGKKVNLVIYNQFGQAVFRQQIEQAPVDAQRISLKAFDNGLHMVQLTTEGKPVVSRKLLVAKTY